MASCINAPDKRKTRKTRIVCISDTHNRTPKLPPGDVLIHAGDLTNQGSISELSKAVEWIEQTDFEVKIVIAGNHDITLHHAFYQEHGSSWRWPAPQNSHECRKLLRESSSITYLENEARRIRLISPHGPKTAFTVFGSPCTPKHANWAFQYEAQEAETVWSRIPDSVDVVVTHTPPLGLCDGATDETQSGCPALLKRLAEVKPLLSVCGHIHQARGVSRATWSTNTGSDSSLVQHMEHWVDPGLGSKKMSLVDSTKSLRGPRRQLEATARTGNGAGHRSDTCGLEDESRSGGGKVVSTSSPVGGTDVGKSEAPWTLPRPSKTIVINAAHLGPRVKGKAMEYNKAIVVDVELPVWHGQDDESV